MSSFFRLFSREWFRRNRTSVQVFEFDVVCVNGSNNPPILKQNGDNWTARFIKETFICLIWDMEDM